MARHLYEECVHKKAQGASTNANVYFYRRNVLGGAVFAMAVPGIAMITAELLAYVRYGAVEGPGSQALKLTLVSWTVLVACAAGAGMTWQGWLTLLVVCLTVAALARDFMSPAAAVLGADILLMVTGVITPAQAFAGFSNAAPITVAALFVLAAALGFGAAPGVTQDQDQRGAPVTNYDPAVGIGVARPDVNVFKVQASMWW